MRADKYSIPEYEEAYTALVRDILNGAVASHPLFGGIRIFRTKHSGPSKVVADESTLELPMELIESETRLTFVAAQTLDVESHTVAMAELMESHLDSMMRSFIPVVERSLDFSNGAAVRISTEPGEFQASYLEALDSMTIQFDENGMPANIAVLGGPEIQLRLTEAMHDESFRAGLERILTKKRREYYAAGNY